MTAIVETSTYTATITQLETTDLVLGGVGGPSNRALVEIANRTKWLYDRVQSLTELPVAALAFPTIATADNRLTVTRSAATAGGKVAIASGTRLTLAEEVVAATTGRLRTFTTASYLSADLLVSSTYYLRAQVDVSGNLEVYVQRGTDADTIPAGLRGTPGAASGGGFDSTVFDILIAKVVTGTAGTLPTVTALANASSFVIDKFDSILCSVAAAFVFDTVTINLARKVEPVVALQGWSIGYGVGAGGVLVGNYRDGTAMYAAHSISASNIPQTVFCFASTVTRYSITVSAESSESDITQEVDQPLYYQVSIRG